MRRFVILILLTSFLKGWSQPGRPASLHPDTPARYETEARASSQPDLPTDVQPDLKIAALTDADPHTARIDKLLEKSLDQIRHYGDQAGLYAEQALEESRKIHYMAGIALALACRAAYTKQQTNDFIQVERQTRQALDTFRLAGNKRYITLAYYELGFALFAQSRFSEAIEYLQMAKEADECNRDSVGLVNTTSLMGCTYRESGEYEKAFEINRRCLKMAHDIHHGPLEESEYYQLAQLFIAIEDYSSAAGAFHAGFAVNAKAFDYWTALVYARLLSRQQKFDSALYYFNKFDSAGLPPAMLRTYLVSKGEFYLDQGKPDQALKNFEKSLVYQRQLNDRNQIMRCLKDLSLASLRLGRDRDAMRYARESLGLAIQFRARQFIRDNCQTLYSIYDKAGRPDSAYAFYRRYISMKDSVNNEQLAGKFAVYSYEQQIAMLNKEKQLQDVCLRETLATKKLLIVGIVALLLIGFLFSRYVMQKRKNEAHLRQRAENELEIQRLESEKSRVALQERAKELEIQALRSQMNPHFIFNCLNAINRFILSHETEAASDYLTKFSRLMRMIMNHSRHSTISLADELEVLRLYLDMERLRFKNAFDYSIVIDALPDVDDIQIPPLLLQPFVENAVWHGLMNKEERGSLELTVHAEGDILTCIIRDDGVGRAKAGMLKSKSAQKNKSMGLQITAERLALLTGKDSPGHFFRINDLYDVQGRPAGTEVVLTISIASPAQASQTLYENNTL